MVCGAPFYTHREIIISSGQNRVTDPICIHCQFRFEQQIFKIPGPNNETENKTHVTRCFSGICHTQQMSKLDRICVISTKTLQKTIILRHCSLKGSFRTTSLSVSMTFQHEHQDKKLAGSRYVSEDPEIKSQPINKQISSKCLCVF